MNFFNLENIHGVKNRHGLTFHFKTDGQQIHVHTEREKSHDLESSAEVVSAAASASTKKKRKGNKRSREANGDSEDTNERDQLELLRDKWNMYMQEPPSKNGIGRKTVISNDPGHCFIMTATRHEVEETDGNVKRLPMDLINHYPKAKVSRPSYQPKPMSKRSLQREERQKEAKQTVYQLSNGAYHHLIGTKALRQWHMKERTINGLAKMDALLSQSTRNTFDNNEYCAYIRIVLDTKWWNLLWHHQSKPIYRKKRFTQLQTKARAFAQIARDLACGEWSESRIQRLYCAVGKWRVWSHTEKQE